MQKVQRSWVDVVKDLNAHLKQSKQSYTTISEASGVNYYAIRRLRMHGAHSKTGNALKLCTFFKIPLTSDQKVQPNEFNRLVSVLEEAWDGSEPHAKLLTKLIRSTKSFRVGSRKAA